MPDLPIIAEVLVIFALALVLAAWLGRRLASREIRRGLRYAYCEERIRRSIRVREPIVAETGRATPED